ncbi:uncharacterized protein LOC116257776 [Nymphaea colorata]|nr:uncharacterized protein LOC116257776 [Nymphaea colorata]
MEVIRYVSCVCHGYTQGERYVSHRLLWSVKNRFGSTDELGVFEMSQSGLQAASNPSENNCNAEVLAGLAISVIIDGSRIFLLEVQFFSVIEHHDVRMVLLFGPFF